MRLNADDHITKVTLNGNTLFQGSGGVYHSNTLVLPTGPLASTDFNSGPTVNVITVEVEDTGAGGTGLIVDGTLTYQDCERLPIRNITDLTSITFWESTSATPTSPMFEVGSAQLSTKLSGTLSSTNRDFEGVTGSEFYDVFYSDWDGAPNSLGEFVTIEAVWPVGAPRGGGLNIARVDFDGTGKSANSVASFVALGDNALPNNVGNAVDVDPNVLTDTTMGNTIEQTQRLRVTVGFPCGCVAPPSDMVAWWPLDETASATSFQDIIGGNNGAPLASPVGTTLGPQPIAGVVGGAIHFPKFGNGLSGARVDPQGALANIGAANFTIDAWVQVPAATANQLHYIVNKFDTTQNRGYALYIVSPGVEGNERLEFKWGDGSNVSTVQTISSLTTDQWHHVAVTFVRNAASSPLDIRLYVDGVQRGQQTGNPPGLGSLVNFISLEIGWQPSSIDEPITIDELEIFNRALLQSEIQSLVNAGSAGKCRPDSCPAITIDPATLQNGTAGVAYTQSVTATGGAKPDVFRLDSGSLPAGMTLSSDGQLMGTPIQTGLFTFTVKVTDANGCIGTRSYQLVVECPEIIISPALPSGTTGSAYDQTLTATGGCAPHSFRVAAGTLPSGLTLSLDGTLSGTPTVPGNFHFIASVSNSCGCTGTRSYLLTINCGAVGRPYTYRAGNVDNFALPNDPTSRNSALTAAFPAATWKNFDDPAINRFVGHTFTGLPSNIVKAELEVRRSQSIGFNDTINLAFTPGSPTVVWSIPMVSLATNNQTFTLDVANLPPNGSFSTNLIPTLAAKRSLDVVIQDDTTVDYIKLHIWTCPARFFAFGLPHDVLGQAELNKDADGNLVVSQIGSTGLNGVEIDLGQAGGWDGEWSEIDQSTLPVGAFLQTKLTGSVDGIPNAEIGTARVVKTAQSVALQTSFASLGATTLRYDFYRAGQLIETHKGQPGNQPLRMAAGGTKWTRDAHYSIIGSAGIGNSNNQPCTTPGYPCLFAGYTFGNTLASFRIGTGITTADEVRVYPEDAGVGAVGGNLRVGITLSNIPKLTIRGEAIRAFGLIHRALGGATFEAFESGLATAGLDDGALDGELIELGKANSFNFELDPIDLLGAAPLGASLQAETFGSRNGALNQSLGKLTITKTNADYLFMPDFSLIGSNTQRIQILNGDAAVLELAGQTAPVITASSWPRQIGTIGGHLVESFTFEFDSGTTFRVNGTTYHGNRLRVLAENLTGVTDFRSAFALRAGRFREFTLKAARVNSLDLPVDPITTNCKVTAAEFNSWFETGAVSLNGVAKPANSVTFSDIANCDFYKWSAQMFLWVNSPAPPRYGGGARIFGSPAFFDVSSLDANNDRTLIPHGISLNSTQLGLMSARVAPTGRHGLSLIRDTDGTTREIEPPQFGPTGKQLILNNRGERFEIGRIKTKYDKKPVFFDTAGRVIEGARPLIRTNLPDLNPALIVQEFRVNADRIFLDPVGNVVNVEQGQADGSVLMSQNGSLVYYMSMVNDVYAFFLTGTKNGEITLNPTQFPTTQAELDEIIAFAQDNGTTFPDPEALAIELKTAWVEAAGLPNLSTYITMTATIPTYDTKNPNLWVPKVPNGQKTALMALVGMHVVGSTAGHPEMIWATFDHKDNAPSGTYTYLSTSGVKRVDPDFSQDYLFCAANPDTSQLNKAHMRQLLGNPGDPVKIEAIGSFKISPSNTIRGNAWGAALTTSPNPIVSPDLFNPTLATVSRSNSELISLNNNVRGMLDGADVRNNYIFTGATWTINGAGATSNYGRPGNVVTIDGTAVGTSQLANVTMETYQQAIQQTLSPLTIKTTFNKFGNNCFSCHGSNTTRVSHIFFTAHDPTRGIKPLF
jgi:hypothetical protein